MKKKVGRPSKFTVELAEDICNTVALSTQSIQTLILKNSSWPDYQTIYSWMKNNEKFQEMYARAKEDQADHLCEDILRIIDKPETYIDEKGIERSEVNMCKLKVDALKWHAMKLKPKRWGPNAEVEELKADNERVKRELEMLRAKLDSQNKKEY